ncbi:MAG: hypothetical protein KF791_06115 [Verrucomicrobiae bacterium]|nr:hypothetical protein [Verrucomicrobiae bacterium]
MNVLTAQLDDTTGLDEPALLDRATSLGRVMFCQDEDLLVEATRRQRGGHYFGGVVYAHQLGVTIGRAVNDLVILAQVPRTGGDRTSGKGGPQSRTLTSSLWTP